MIINNKIKIATMFCILVHQLTHACMADTLLGKDAKIQKLYEQAFARYEKCERENAHVVQVNGITMAYLDFGAKNGVPLLWAHGSGLTGYEILNVKDGLVAAGYRVIAIDYRGHGKTQITDFNTSLYDVADDMVGLLDHLHISKAVVGGLSKGGFVAAAFYDEYPERTMGLLLEDGGSWSDQKWKDQYPMTEEMLAASKKYATDMESTRYASRIDMFRAVYDSWAESSGEIDNATIYFAVNALSQWRINAEGKWVFHVDRKLMSGDGSALELKQPSRHTLMQWSQQAMIPQIIFRNLDVPVHIIDPVSDNDMIPATEQNEALKHQHPDLIEHEIYENTGHTAHFERPERFVESAKALLKRVGAYQ